MCGKGSGGLGLNRWQSLCLGPMWLEKAQGGWYVGQGLDTAWPERPWSASSLREWRAMLGTPAGSLGLNAWGEC